MKTIWAIYRGAELIGSAIGTDELDALHRWALAEGIAVERDGDVLSVADDRFDDVAEIRAVRVEGCG